MLRARRGGRHEVACTWCCEPASELAPGCPQAPALVAPAREARPAESASRPAPRPAVITRRAGAVDVVDERCGGLASHPKSVVACLLRPGPNRQTEQASRTVGTMPDALLALADGLAEPAVPPVALASTGVDWQPSWTLLEDRCELRLVQAQHRQPGPGRTPDVTARAWSADLRRQGRLTASCVPDRPRRERRALPRARTARLQDRAA